MKQTIRAAALTPETKPGALSANLDLIAGAARRAAQEGAELALFPELSLTGFIPNHPTGDHAAWLKQALLAARQCAQPLDGEAVGTLTAIARDTRLYLAVGLLEDAGNRLHNTLLLVGPEGLAAAWRKMHVPMYEMPFYNGGPVPAVVQTPLGRIGANICFDALLPESARLLAAQNVELVLFPFAADPPPGTPAAWAAWAVPPLQARCAENGVFGLACNYQGRVTCAGIEQTFPGGAIATGPRGEIIARNVDGAGTLIVEFHSATLLDARADPDYLYRFRRPELYKALAE
ncbi:MAG: carbon-nitrogen hydrolase family protein [Bryobacterales bacterium]|nr:carbon-nitrogen hydrolase family protein [Bryobacterales bacterium]